MPLLPLKALRRHGHDEDEGENGGRRRVTRGVTLAPTVSESTPSEGKVGNNSFVRSKSLQPLDVVTPASVTPVSRTTLTPPAASGRNLQRASAPHVLMTPVRPRVTFAPSPHNTSTDVTPYARVYGVHPAFFDFDQNGAMQPTQAGACEMQRGALHLTPTGKGRMALVVQGTQSPSGSSGVGSPVCASPLSCWSMSPAARPHQSDMQFALGEQVLVLTDDCQAWMDAQVLATFLVDTEAEGYSIPGGTVKVSYELGIKWIMPQNIAGTLRKKALSFGSFAPPPRQAYSFAHPVPPQGAAAWQVFPGHIAYAGRAT